MRIQSVEPKSSTALSRSVVVRHGSLREVALLETHWQSENASECFDEF